MQKLLQNQMNDRMKEISEASQMEALTMRIFQLITLVFLPVTVVSVSSQPNQTTGTSLFVICTNCCSTPDRL